jgi:hypothetical protein
MRIGAVKRWRLQGLALVCGLGVVAVFLSAASNTAHADGNPVLTGTFFGDDNGVYYLQQIGSAVWWMGESVDPDADPNGDHLGPYHVWNRGVYSTSVFQGTVSGSTLSGQWVEVNRGGSLRTGSLSTAISTNAQGMAHLTLTSGTAPCNHKQSVNGPVDICASEWTQGDPVFDSFFQDPTGHTLLLPFFDRFRHAKKSLRASNDDDDGDRLGDTPQPEQLRPYRDQTVFYGVLTTRNPLNDEWPHINFPPKITNLPPKITREYHNFACVANDGDLDLRVRVDTTRLPPDFQKFGWDAARLPPFWLLFGYDRVAVPQDLVPKLLNVGLFDSDAAAALHLSTPGRWSYIGAEAVMYGGDRTEDCPGTANMVFPGWADTGGNSVLVNSRPIEGSADPDNVVPLTVADVSEDPLACPACTPLSNDQIPLSGLNGYRMRPATETLGGDPWRSGTEVRVTGALILDCGHSVLFDSDDEKYVPPSGIISGGKHSCQQGEGWGEDYTQNQEIHPVYSVDLIECPLGIYSPCAGQSARQNLTGAWGSEDGGTYYVRQIGSEIWMLGLTRNRDPIMPDDAVMAQIPNPTIAFNGTISNHSDGSAVITGQAVTLPKGAQTGGEVTTATFTLDSNRKHFDLSSSGSPTFYLPSHFDKLYEPPDKTPPSITLTTPPAGAAYTLNQVVRADYACQDEPGGSGLESCTGNVAKGSPIDTASVGAKTFSENAADNAGNTSSVTHNYRVNYIFSGFLAPVNNPPTVNLGKAGRTYQIKWQLGDANGNRIRALSAIDDITFKSTPCSAFSTNPTDSMETVTSGSSGLRYDSTTHSYVYNWATPSTKGCYTLLVRLDSGQSFSAYFNLSQLPGRKTKPCGAGHARHDASAQH